MTLLLLTKKRSNLTTGFIFIIIILCFKFLSLDGGQQHNKPLFVLTTKLLPPAAKYPIVLLQWYWIRKR